MRIRVDKKKRLMVSFIGIILFFVINMALFHLLFFLIYKLTGTEIIKSKNIFLCSTAFASVMTLRLVYRRIKGG